MSHFSQYVTCRLNFDNGYSMSFEHVTGLGSVFCTLRRNGEQTDLGKFITCPGKGDGFFAYLSPEDFAEVIYRISKEKKEEIDVTPGAV